MPTAPLLEPSVKTVHPDARTSDLYMKTGAVNVHGREERVKPPLSSDAILSSVAGSPVTLAGLDHAMHLWMLPALDTASALSLAELNTLLSDDERARALSFYFPEHRDAFVANRGRLRVVLAHYLDCLPQDIRFLQGAQGKPELAYHQGHGLTFNLSHTKGLAVLALARGRQVGVDVEQLKPLPDLLDTARQYFSENEYQQLAALPSAELCAAFYACWTRKEAFLKGLGTGLARNLAEFQVSLLPGTPAALLACQWSPELCQSWRLYSLDLGDGYQGALACEQNPQWSPLGLRTFTWSFFNHSARNR